MVAQRPSETASASGDRPDAFLSYACDDSDFVEDRLARALAERGTRRRSSGRTGSWLQQERDASYLLRARGRGPAGDAKAPPILGLAGVGLPRRPATQRAVPAGCRSGA